MAFLEFAWMKPFARASTVDACQRVVVETRAKITVYFAKITVNFAKITVILREVHRDLSRPRIGSHQPSLRRPRHTTCPAIVW
ncbi:MAG: hypothetical protein U0470_00600 [Anaerolineae bacterium]